MRMAVPIRNRRVIDSHMKRTRKNPHPTFHKRKFVLWRCLNNDLRRLCSNLSLLTLMTSSLVSLGTFCMPVAHTGMRYTSAIAVWKMKKNRVSTHARTKRKIRDLLCSLYRRNFVCSVSLHSARFLSETVGCIGQPIVAIGLHRDTHRNLNKQKSHIHTLVARDIHHCCCHGKGRRLQLL